MARSPKRSDDLARLIRLTNSSIHVAVGALDSLDPNAPPAITAALREAHLAALDAGLGTLAIKLTDVKAYRKGAQEMVGHLDALDPLLRDLAAAAGIPDQLPPPPPSPTPSASPSTEP